MFRIILLKFIVIGLLLSCNKSFPTGNNNNNSLLDTIGVGWTMSKIDLQQFTNIHFVQNNGILVTTTGTFGSNNDGVSWQQRSTHGCQAFGTGYNADRNIRSDSVGNVIAPQGLVNGSAGNYFLAKNGEVYRTRTVVFSN